MVAERTGAATCHQSGSWASASTERPLADRYASTACFWRGCAHIHPRLVDKVSIRACKTPIYSLEWRPCYAARLPRCSIYEAERRPNRSPDARPRKPACSKPRNTALCDEVARYITRSWLPVIIAGMENPRRIMRFRATERPIAPIGRSGPPSRLFGCSRAQWTLRLRRAKIIVSPGANLTFHKIESTASSPRTWIYRDALWRRVGHGLVRQMVTLELLSK